MQPEISIIVPVYKVEKYLRRCIDSILAQTFKNFELILIDDGSPDNCGKICDEYAEKDERVVVIHKENGGQSSARNLGLDTAKGKYIGFVDSDDWIEPDMYETLYNLILKSDKDISNIGFSFISEKFSKKFSNHSEIYLNRDEAIEELIKHKLYGNYFCMNLFKSSLIKNFRFKEGIIFEDIDLMYKIIHVSNGLITSGESKYNYLQREDSTVGKVSKKLTIDFTNVLYERKNFLNEKYKEIYTKNKNIINENLIYQSQRYINYFIKNELKSNNFKDFYKCIKILNSCFWFNLFSKNNNLKEKMILIILRINLKAYLFFLKNYYNKKEL
ncbi:glycosyltransferase family 2 protein [Cetobacterium sp.]|uniref:glycosyltransferase family 2 protein n=1 Tax=Cetobacterium sp. TaxID=2071632 RepID=UPI003F2E01BD